MATHTYFGGASVSDWRDVDFITVVRVAGDEVVILNSDGTETRLFSANGDFVDGVGGITGSVSSMARTDDGGGVTYETVSNISVGVSDLLAGGGQLFDLLLGMAATIYGPPAGDLSAYLGGWSDLGIAPMGYASGAEFVAQTSVVAHLDGAGLSGGSLSESLALAGFEGTFAVATVADYGGAASTVTVDLATGRASVGDSAVTLLETVVDIEGSAFADHLIGDARDNVIAGGEGNDLITLGDGNDTVLVGLGDGWDTITDFGLAGQDTINLAGYDGIMSFAQLLEEQRLLTVDGHAVLQLNGGDGLVFQNLTSHTLLSASQFQF